MPRLPAMYAEGVANVSWRNAVAGRAWCGERWVMAVPAIMIERPTGADRRYRRASQDAGTVIGVPCCDSVDTLLDFSILLKKLNNISRL